MKTSSPAEIVGSIDDLLTELFLRLPLKPHVQLKLVSKRWNSLISDPKLHSSRNDNNKPVGFIFQIPSPWTDDYRGKKEKAYLLSLDRSSPPSITELNIAEEYIMDKSYRENEVGNKIFHSSNGLLVGYLCEYTDKYDEGDYDIKDYFVYNPTTGEYKSIPRQRGLGFIRWMYLAVDPSNPPHYKIVCVLSSSRWITYKLSQYKFAVYSSKTRSWKKYDNSFSSEFKFENGVYWNGSIHWISLSKTGKSIYFSPPDHDDDHDDWKGDEDDDDSFLVLLIQRMMVVYNVVNGTFEIIREFDEDDDDEILFSAFRSDLKLLRGLSLKYIESLCLV